MTDILDQIDSTLAEVSSCACGCGKSISEKGPSADFSDELCQARWAASVVGARPEFVMVREPSLTLADMEAASAAVRARRAPPVVAASTPSTVTWIDTFADSRAPTMRELDMGYQISATVETHHEDGWTIVDETHVFQAMQPDRDAPPVDAALEPQPTGDEIADFAEATLGVEVEPWQRQMLHQLTEASRLDVRPWWRRMLGDQR